jgi:hypothetical protein
VGGADATSATEVAVASDTAGATSGSGA